MYLFVAYYFARNKTECWCISSSLPLQYHWYTYVVVSTPHMPVLKNNFRPFNCQEQESVKKRSDGPSTKWICRGCNSRQAPGTCEWDQRRHPRSPLTPLLQIANLLVVHVSKDETEEALQSQSSCMQLDFKAFVIRSHERTPLPDVIPRMRRILLIHSS